MQSLRLLIATAVLVIAATAQPNKLSAWDPTIRDKTEECKKITDFAQDENAKCQLFDLCCKQPDPLNGDKCTQQYKKCEIGKESGKLEFTCTYSNCTEMITTTTTTTTQSPRQINGASAYSAFLSASALLPLFF